MLTYYNGTMQKTKVLVSAVSDPWFNLATEDWIFREMEPDGHILYLWRNSETVVIGRYQNPWAECNLEHMKRDGVKLARRQSGGGAVYHDIQNVNFTFLSGRDVYDRDRNFRIIIEALAGFGINAEVSGRNDLVVDGRKVSGSAFKLTSDRAFHHGTMLIDVDLGRLAGYLNPDKRKLASKGVKSVRSRVANLVEFNPDFNADGFCSAVSESFYRTLGEGTTEVLDYSSLEKIPHLIDYYELMKSDEWLYQKSPDFSHRIENRFDWGGIDINIDVRRGVINDVVVFSDCLFPEMIEELICVLKGAEYSREAVSRALSGMHNGQAWDGCLDDVEKLLSAEI